MEKFIELLNQQLDVLMNLYSDNEEIKKGIEIAKNRVNTEYSIYKNEMFLKELKEKLKMIERERGRK